MTDSPARPQIGIVSDTALQRHRLQEASGRFGLHTHFSGSPERLAVQSMRPAVDLWLVALEEDEADHPGLFELLLDDSDIPVLFGIDLAPRPGTTDYFRWERRLLDKLEQQFGLLEQLDSADSLEALASEPAAPATSLPRWIAPAVADAPAAQVWVLGASLGGPAAVKTFLDHLPPDLPVGFVYAQHIDGHFAEVLTRVLGRHAHYRLKQAEDGQPVRNGEVVLLPVENEWTLDAEGLLQRRDTPWPGPYGPSIDQVLLNVGDHFGSACHAIIFSGMGNDGAIAAPLLKAYGSRIWVQSGGSCANSAMPDSVAATGCSSFSGTPEQLARELVKTIEESCLPTMGQQRDSA